MNYDKLREAALDAASALLDDECLSTDGKTRLADAIRKAAARSEEGPSPDNEIAMFMHCSMCLNEWKGQGGVGESPKTYSRLSVGWTPKGMQVWCDRHEVNVLHVDFEGAKHVANTGRRVNG